MATFSVSDIRYITSEYRTLGELCDGRVESAGEVLALIDAGRLPAATYVLPSGEARFPPDYFQLVDDAGGVDTLPSHFRARYLTAASPSASALADADEDWSGYLSGGFGICLRKVTPEAMAEKNRLIRRIEELLDAPAPTDPVWCGALRTAVDALDELERPFTDYDLERWGDTSRNKHITRVREAWPAVFDLARRGA
jgi:hypothetical protein